MSVCSFFISLAVSESRRRCHCVANAKVVGQFFANFSFYFPILNQCVRKVSIAKVSILKCTVIDLLFTIIIAKNGFEKWLF